MFNAIIYDNTNHVITFLFDCGTRVNYTAENFDEIQLDFPELDSVTLVTIWDTIASWKYNWK